MDLSLVNLSFSFSEKKLNNIFRLRKEQDKIITLRTEASKQYVKLLEKEATIRFEKLVNISI